MNNKRWPGILLCIWLMLGPGLVVHSPISFSARPSPGVGGGAQAPSRSEIPSADLPAAIFQIIWSTGCSAPPPEIVTAVQDAADDWGELISSPIEIAVSACWTSTTSCGSPGCGAPTAFFYDFAGAPQAGTHYPAALANALSGQDLNAGLSEIKIDFDAGDLTSGWYSPYLVAEHEFGHGLAFYSGMYENYNVGFCGDGPYGFMYTCPTIYDRFTVDRDGIPLLSYKSPDPRVMGAKLKSDANFGGPNARYHNAGLPARLYAPAIFDYASSLSHLDNSFASTDGLMTLSGGSSIGPVTLGLLQDLGWKLRDGSPNLSISGPAEAGKGAPVTYAAQVEWSIYSGQSVTYTWSLPGGTTVIHKNQDASDTLTWQPAELGFVQVNVVASGPFHPTGATRGIVVKPYLYLPVVIK